MLALLAADAPAATPSLEDLLTHPVIILIGGALGAIAAVLTVAFASYKKARGLVEQTVRTEMDGASVEVHTIGEAKLIENPNATQAVQSHYEQLIVEQRHVNVELGKIVEGYRTDMASLRADVSEIKVLYARAQHEIAIREDTIESLKDLIAQYKMDAEKNYIKIRDLELQLQVKTSELADLKAEVEKLKGK